MLGHDTPFYFWLGQVISGYVMLGLVLSGRQFGSGYIMSLKDRLVQIMSG
jgi:hypothetical protein